jgi:hypothetical protein
LFGLWLAGCAGKAAVQKKLLCRKSCCVEKAAVLNFAVWQFGWLSRCEQMNCLK